MLTPQKRTKLLNAVKAYSKRYLDGRIKELDESGTRLMINAFLSDVLGYEPIEEIKTEYMIRGTYADYVLQVKGVRYFLVEVKSLSLSLSDKHLRQTINYGANEGIEWALLTNGKSFDFYKILFNKPIEWRKVFTFDFSDQAHIKASIDHLQYLHRDLVVNKGLSKLWNKSLALEPSVLAGLLYSPTVTSYITRQLSAKYNSKFLPDEIEGAITRLICSPVDKTMVKKEPVKRRKVESPTIAPMPENIVQSAQ